MYSMEREHRVGNTKESDPEGPDSYDENDVRDIDSSLYSEDEVVAFKTSPLLSGEQSATDLSEVGHHASSPQFGINLHHSDFGASNSASKTWAKKRMPMMNADEASCSMIGSRSSSPTTTIDMGPP